MPWLLWHACELVHYRLKLSPQFLCCLFLCLSATTTLTGSAGSMDSVSVNSNRVASCDAVGCQDCSPSAATATRPYFRTAMARSVYSKILVDEEFKNFDRTKVKKIPHTHFLCQPKCQSGKLPHHPRWRVIHRPTLMRKHLVPCVCWWWGGSSNES